MYPFQIDDKVGHYKVHSNDLGQPLEIEFNYKIKIPEMFGVLFYTDASETETKKEVHLISVGNELVGVLVKYYHGNATRTGPIPPMTHSKDFDENHTTTLQNLNISGYLALIVVHDETANLSDPILLSVLGLLINGHTPKYGDGSRNILAKYPIEETLRLWTKKNPQLSGSRDEYFAKPEEIVIPLSSPGGGVLKPGT
ncbi:MAG: hypothetical protein ABNH00_10430 [Dokdonia sp.]|jgi:hypothetical protein